jgi:hypothetical protein
VNVTNPNVRLTQSVTTCAVIVERQDWSRGQERIYFALVSTDRARYNHRDQTTGRLQSMQRDDGGNSPFIFVGHSQTTPEHRQVPSCIGIFLLIKSADVIVLALIEFASATPKPPSFVFNMIRVPLAYFSAVRAWITHSIPPTELNFVNNQFNLNDGPHQIINVVADQQRIDVLHGVNKTCKTTHLSVEHHLTIGIGLIDGVANLF